MSQFVVSARKYRPARFEDVVGQEHISNTLKNALQTGHLAHAFLFCGPRGVGKTTCARILAKVINCQNIGADFEPCNTCDSCRAFNENASFNITELDAASNNTVDAMRNLIDQVRFQPQQGKYKVFIIDEVHMLSASAFNAFLKTLEEPPPYAIFILATTEKHKILATILSRCQIYDFRRITIQDTVKHLQHICSQEGIEADDAALHIIAQKADGALRDALSIFDRMVAAGGNHVRYEAVLENLNVLDYDYYFRLVDGLLSEDLPGVMLLFDEVCRKGFDPDIFILGLAEHLRNLLVCKDEAMLSLLESGESLRERYRAQARLAPATLLLSALNLANDCDLNFKMARNKRLHTEMALIKMTYIQRAVRRTPFVAEAETPEKKTLDGRVATQGVESAVGGGHAERGVGSEQLAVSSGQSAVGGEQLAVATQGVESAVATQGVESAVATQGVESAVGSGQLPQSPIPDQQSSILNPQSPIENTPPHQHINPSVNQQIASEPNPPYTPENKPALRTAGKHSMTKLSSIDAMLKDHLQPSEEDTGALTPPLTSEALHTALMTYVEGIKSASARTFLRTVELETDAEHITAKVGSALAESTVREETGLIEYLRKHFSKPSLTLSVKVEKRDNGAPEQQPRAMPLNDKEKLRQMQQSNSNLKVLWERFGLMLEGDE